jgi:molecular chaperone DnaK
MPSVPDGLAPKLGATQPLHAPPPPLPPEPQPDPAATIPRPLVFDEVLRAERASHPGPQAPIAPQPVVHLGATQALAQRPAPPSEPPPVLAPAVVSHPAAIAPMNTPLPPVMLAPLTPVLVDVTPRALVVETVGGWCDVVVQRNAKIPCERTRAFATSSDMQTTVRVRVAQGEDATFSQNTYLGEVELSGLRAAPRGQVTIQVRFEVDESGTLKVFASDISTGREANATLQLVGIAGGPSVSAMVARHAAVRVH